MTSPGSFHRIVLAPDGLGEALTLPAAEPLLSAWRDGRVRPVVTRSLLLRYFRLFHRLGLPERLVRWWGWWLGSPERAILLPEAEAPASLLSLVESLARNSETGIILCGAGMLRPTTTSPRWVTVSEFLRELGASGSLSNGSDTPGKPDPEYRPGRE